ncbi:MAG TPA: hypothetical protein VGM74_13120 [Burkholderiaceae bacterium]
MTLVGAVVATVVVATVVLGVVVDATVVDAVDAVLGAEWLLERRNDSAASIAPVSVPVPVEVSVPAMAAALESAASAVSVAVSALALAASAGAAAIVETLEPLVSADEAPPQALRVKAESSASAAITVPFRFNVIRYSNCAVSPVKDRRALLR